MAFVPASRTPERILSFGDAGTGKSYDALMIARRLAKTDTDAKIYIVNTDLSTPRMLEDRKFAKIEDMVVYEQVVDYISWRDTVRQYARQMGRNDWLFLDLLTPGWAWAQERFIEKVFGEDDEEYFLQFRADLEANPKDQKLKSRQRGGGLQGRMDWPFINKLHNAVMGMLYQARGHVFAICEQGDLDDNDDKKIRSLFENYGVKPKGQKAIPHYFHTIIYKTRTKKGLYQAFSVRDKSRELMEELEMKDFSKQYLERYAGWTVEG